MEPEKIKQLEKKLSDMGRVLVCDDVRIRPGHAADWLCKLRSGKHVRLCAYSYEAALAGAVLLLDDPLPARAVIGEYYWVKAKNEWEVCRCVEADAFPHGICFEMIGVEGTGYAIPNVIDFLPISKPPAGKRHCMVCGEIYNDCGKDASSCECPNCEDGYNFKII